MRPSISGDPSGSVILIEGQDALRDLRPLRHGETEMAEGMRREEPPARRSLDELRQLVDRIAAVPV